jgi:hypothetical protein
MKRIIATLLFIFWPGLVLASAQRAVFFGMNRPSASVGCNAPSQMTEDWPVFGPNVSCDGLGAGSCPTSGAFKIDTVPSTLSANSVVQTANGARAIWTANAFNSLAGANFNGVSSRLSYTTNETYTSGVVLVAYAHQVPTSGSDPMFGSMAAAALEFRLFSNQLGLVSSNTAVIGSGVNTYTAGSWHTFAATWNDSTGAWAVYDCHGGTCVLDSSGIASGVHLSSANNQLGVSDGSTEFGQGITLDWQVASGTTSIAGIAAYSSCKFGI